MIGNKPQQRDMLPPPPFVDGDGSKLGKCIFKFMGVVWLLLRSSTIYSQHTTHDVSEHCSKNVGAQVFATFQHQLDTNLFRNRISARFFQWAKVSGLLEHDWRCRSVCVCCGFSSTTIPLRAIRFFLSFYGAKWFSCCIYNQWRSTIHAISRQFSLSFVFYAPEFLAQKADLRRLCMSAVGLMPNACQLTIGTDSIGRNEKQWNNPFQTETMHIAFSTYFHKMKIVEVDSWVPLQCNTQPSASIRKSFQTFFYQFAGAGAHILIR